MGTRIETKRLYDWLSLGSFLDGNSQRLPVRERESNRNISFLAGASSRDPNRKSSWRVWTDGPKPRSSGITRSASKIVSYGASPPNDFGLWCLERAVAVVDTKPQVADHLLEQAVWGEQASER